MTRDHLIASRFTLTGAGIGAAPRFSFPERVAAAAAAGFTGIGLDADDYAACRAAGMSDADVRAVLADHGIRAAELEFVHGWARRDGGMSASEEYHMSVSEEYHMSVSEEYQWWRQNEDRLYAVADVVGARHLNVGDVNPAGGFPPLDLVAERFAALCDRAAAHGLQVAIEFLPWTDIPDVATAWEIARRAGRANGGLLVDTWHYFRGAGNEAALRTVPPERIVAVQIDDADAPSGAPYEDTLRRRLPGEGTFDLVGFVRLLDGLGVAAPLSVEIISPEQAARPLAEAAQRAHDSTRAIVDRARRRSPRAR